MTKTITVRKYEFERTLEGIINQAGLPAFVVESVLKDTIVAVKAAADAQLKKDLEEYNAGIEREMTASVHEQGQVRIPASENQETQ